MSKTTTRVRYVGPHDAVLVVDPVGNYSTPVAHGDEYETTPEHAEQLLEQTTNWAPAKAPAKAAKAAKEEVA